jgi:hypothetical protein
LVGDLQMGDGYRSKEAIKVLSVPLPILTARRFPVWKRRTHFFTCVNYVVLLWVGSANLGHRRLNSSRPMHFNKRRAAPSIAHSRISRSCIVLPHIFLNNRISPEKPVWATSGSQHREVWKQPDRLPAEGRLGSSGNTSKSRRCLFLLPAWPSLHMRHLFGIGASQVNLKQGRGCGGSSWFPVIVTYRSLAVIQQLIVARPWIRAPWAVRLRPEVHFLTHNIRKHVWNLSTD